MKKAEKKQREQVITEALTWKKTPYHHAARLKGVGVDCGQFVIGVFANCGIIDPFDVPYYPADFALHRDREWYKEIIESYCGSPVNREPIPGDVILYRFGRSFSHGAIVVEPGKVIHSLIDQGVTVSKIDEGRLADRPRLVYSYWRDSDGRK